MSNDYKHADVLKPEVKQPEPESHTVVAPNGATVSGASTVIHPTHGGSTIVHKNPA
jgi:hypothetical protein